MARGLLSERIGRFQCRVELLKRGPELRQQALANLRCCDAACCPVEKPDSKLVLEAADGLAQCGTRDAQMHCSFRKARALGHGHKHVQFGQARLTHCSDFPISSCGSCRIVEPMPTP